MYNKQTTGILVAFHKKNNKLTFCPDYLQAKHYVENENFLSDDEKLLLSCDGNEIGDYVDDDQPFYYDEDGIYDTTYGRYIEDCTELELDKIRNYPDQWTISQDVKEFIEQL